jgi:hypothetical protein
MYTIRRIGAVALIVAAIGIWFGMKPASSDTSSSYGAAITAALAADTANNASATGTPQQTVVNGWTAKDLLTIIANEGASPQPLPVDGRPAALLTLVVIGFGLELATSRLPAREPVMNSPSVVEPVLAAAPSS